MINNIECIAMQNFCYRKIIRCSVLLCTCFEVVINKNLNLRSPDISPQHNVLNQVMLQWERNCGRQRERRQLHLLHPQGRCSLVILFYGQLKLGTFTTTSFRMENLQLARWCYNSSSRGQRWQMGLFLSEVPSFLCLTLLIDFLLGLWFLTTETNMVLTELWSNLEKIIKSQNMYLYLFFSPSSGVLMQCSFNCLFVFCT